MVVEEGKPLSTNGENKHIESLRKKKELKEKLWQQLMEELEATYEQLS